MFCSERRCVPGEQFKQNIQAITGQPSVEVLFDTQTLAREDTQAFQSVYRTLLRSHLFAIPYMFSSPVVSGADPLFYLLTYEGIDRRKDVAGTFMLLVALQIFIINRLMSLCCKSNF